MPDKIKVLIRVSSVLDKKGSLALRSSQLDIVSNIKGFSWDREYRPVLVGSLPNEVDESLVKKALNKQKKRNAYYVRRGKVENEYVLQQLIEAVEGSKTHIDVFIDQEIEFCCNPAPDAYRDSSYISQLLENHLLHDKQMNGYGVCVGIVDGGLNLSYLNQKNVNPRFNSRLSSTARSYMPGDAPPEHGTMCAFNVCLTAPDCTLIDYAIIPEYTQAGLSFLTSDVVRVYGQIFEWIGNLGKDASDIRLVLNNSWGIPSPDLDVPIGHRNRYIDNPTHPFNELIQLLEELGVDILFAAGNHGQGVNGAGTIYGANSHQQVLCIGGVDTSGLLVNTSSRGPGFLDLKKPDLCTYTSFIGSEVFGSGSIDSGTSTACAVASGVVAAIRTLYPSSILSSAQLRQIMRDTAQHSDADDPGYHDYNYGYGTINIPGIIRALEQIDISPSLPQFSTLVQQEPGILQSLKRVANEADTIPTTNFAVTEVILRTIVLPMTEQIISAIGLPWDNPGNYTELWRVTAERWIEDQYQNLNIDREQARIVARELKQLLESTQNHEEWERLFRGCLESINQH